MGKTFYDTRKTKLRYDNPFSSKLKPVGRTRLLPEGCIRNWIKACALALWGRLKAQTSQSTTSAVVESQTE